MGLPRLTVSGADDHAESKFHSCQRPISYAGGGVFCADVRFATTEVAAPPFPAR